MARQDIFLGIQRRNNRLETFLKKKLNADNFERIRAYNSCIVCSNGENKVFKFIILDNEVIYLSENPAKNLLEVIHLEDVISITLENDPPSFLNGIEKDNSQHIQLKYYTDFKNKKDKQCMELFDKRIILNDELLSIYLNAKDCNSAALSLTTRYGFKFSRSVYKKINLTDINFDVKSNSSNIIIEMDDLIEDKNFNPNILNDQTNRNVKNNKVQKNININDDIKYTEKSNTILNEKTIYKNYKNKTAKNEVQSVQNESLILKNELNNSKLNKNVENHRELVLYEETIDIYILKKSSRIFYFMKAAWQNYKLKNAFQIENKLTPKSASSSNKLFISERMEFLFEEIKYDLQKKQISLEDKFSLMLELKNALGLHFVLKKYFWKNGELFNFLIIQFLEYMEIIEEEAKLKLFLTNDLVADDILELILLILEIIELACLETEIYTGRDICFNISNIHLENFITALIKGLQYFENYNPKKINDFKNQYFDLSCKILFELIQAAEMGSMNPETISLNWIVSIFANKIPILLHFIGELFEWLLNILLNTEIIFSHFICVDIYQKLYVIFLFLERDKSIIFEIKKRYYVEFKYKINITSIIAKFPKNIKFADRFKRNLILIRNIIIFE